MENLATASVREVRKILFDTTQGAIINEMYFDNSQARYVLYLLDNQDEIIAVDDSGEDLIIYLNK